MEAAGSGPLFGNISFFIIIFVVFYFFLIKPQQDKEKKRKEMINQLKKGDKILTIGGLRLIVVDIKEDYIVAKTNGDVKIEINKDAVSVVLEQSK